MTGCLPLVSVIIPCFNSEKHIVETVRSVQAQTFKDLEILVVDDCSSDESGILVRDLAESDNRIRLLFQDENKGVAAARNRALAESRGRYIAYLDSDDLWMQGKLRRQLDFMAENRIGACFTSYETIEEDGAYRNTVHVPSVITYDEFLKNTITCSHTLVFDTELVDKKLLVMPDIRRGQDFATWLCILRSGHRIYGLDEPLAKYRKCSGSLSSDPIKSVKRTWNIYRNVEHLPFLYSVYCQFWQLYHAALKRMGEKQ